MKTSGMRFAATFVRKSKQNKQSNKEKKNVKEKSSLEENLF